MFVSTLWISLSSCVFFAFFCTTYYKRLKFALAAFKLFFYKEYLLAITLAMPQMNISTAGHCYSKHLHLFSAGLISNSSAT